MELLSTGINAAVVAAVGLILGWLGKGRIDALERRMNDHFDDVDRRFVEVQARIDRLEDRVDGLRSDLTRVALAVGVRPEAEAGSP